MRSCLSSGMYQQLLMTEDKTMIDAIFEGVDIDPIVKK